MKAQKRRSTREIEMKKSNAVEMNERNCFYQEEVIRKSNISICIIEDFSLNKTEEIFTLQKL
jgi:hypothetical protein